MKTMGLDLSLNSTGWAVMSGDTKGLVLIGHGTFSTEQPRKGPKEKMELRLNLLYGWIMSTVVEHQPAMVAIEASSVSKVRSGKSGGTEERIALQWCIRMALNRMGIECVMVEPSSLKKAWTGSGKAEKDDMVAQCGRQCGVRPDTDDEADAIALAWVAAQVQGAIPVTYSALELVHRLKSGGIV
jgi:Holliday junction resolvasome RuvABC endonuclease subunit